MCKYCKKNEADSECIISGPFHKILGKILLCDKCRKKLDGIYNLECYSLGFLDNDIKEFKP